MNAKLHQRICVIGAGPCGLTAVKNLIAVGFTDVVCYDESDGVGGNWAFTDHPERTSVYESTHLISSKRWSEFEDYPFPLDYPDFPSHRQMLAYFHDYATHFNILPFVRLRTRVDAAQQMDDGRWSVRVCGPDGAAEETFDQLVICSGHHREPLIPDYPGAFAGEVLHSRQYKRPEPYRGKRVLVVGAGNSACDIAVDISRVAERTGLSMRRGYYIIPKIVFGRPVDVLHARIRRRLSRAATQSLFAVLLRLIIVGPWERYGLQTPACRPLEMHPTINTNILSALRDGAVVARVGIERFDGQTVHFRDGSAETFDTVVWATGFHVGFPFLEPSVAGWDAAQPPPLYLKMMHRNLANLFFIGLFQPIGCIWRLADLQARIAALQIAGRLDRPADIARRIEREGRSARRYFENTPRHAVEVDYHLFRRELDRALAGARPS